MSFAECLACDGQGEESDGKDFWGNDLTVECYECLGRGTVELDDA